MFGIAEEAPASLFLFPLCVVRGGTGFGSLLVRGLVCRLFGGCVGVVDGEEVSGEFEEELAVEQLGNYYGDAEDE